MDGQMDGQAGLANAPVPGQGAFRPLLTFVGLCSHPFGALAPQPAGWRLWDGARKGGASLGGPRGGGPVGHLGPAVMVMRAEASRLELN